MPAAEEIVGSRLQVLHNSPTELPTIASYNQEDVIHFSRRFFRLPIIIIGTMVP